jgi:hypothetical protein
MRAIVPGHFGMASVKWAVLRSLEIGRFFLTDG